MKVFKFGGASIKDAAAIKNMSRIIQRYAGEQLLIVVSAMGKTTNALENVVRDRISGKNPLEQINGLHDYHRSICEGLFDSEKHVVFEDLEELFHNIRENTAREYTDPEELYGRIVSYGEIISAMIISHFLGRNMACKLIDAREFIKTDAGYREANVDWETTCQLVNDKLPEVLYKDIIVTQGFIGSSLSGTTTTLGREGSDFSAAIFAHCLHAESVMIWKDVPGILNADPKIIAGTVKFNELPYNEAAEMTYYGASVIHPKTIKPLALKNIPLWVRSFEDQSEPGTCIHDCFVEKFIPSLIFKENQSLVSFYVRDFTFINEKNLSLIFDTLDSLQIKINMMQNSAISFSICVDSHGDKIEKLIHRLKNNFKILYNENLQLITVKHYDNDTIDLVSTDKKILLEQKTRHNYQIVVEKE